MAVIDVALFDIAAHEVGARQRGEALRIGLLDIGGVGQRLDGRFIIPLLDLGETLQHQHARIGRMRGEPMPDFFLGTQQLRRLVEAGSGGAPDRILNGVAGVRKTVFEGTRGREGTRQKNLGTLASLVDEPEQSAGRYGNCGGYGDPREARRLSASSG
jgi:hypothetical protein